MIGLDSLNVIDYAVLCVLGVSGVLAIFRGMTREIIGLIGWGVAIVAARFFQPRVAEYISEVVGDAVGDNTATMLISFALPFVIVVIVWFILANIIAPVLKRVTFGMMDRFLGFLFGLIRGVVVIALIYMAGLLVYDGEADFPDAVTESLSIMPTRVVAATMVGFAPSDFVPGGVITDLREDIPDQTIGEISGEISGEIGKTLTPKAEEAIEEIGTTATETLLPDELTLPDVSQ